MYASAPLLWNAHMGQNSVVFPATEVKDICLSPHGYWELNLDPLQEQSMFLTAQSFLQPPDSELKRQTII